MTGDTQRVEPNALTSQAGEMKAQGWHNPNAEAVAPPDALPSTRAAIANLNANAAALLSYQQWAEQENQRIAEMLEIAAGAYTEVDDTYGKAIEDPQRQAAVDAIPIPAPATPPPPIPSPPGTPQLLDAGGYSDVNKTEVDLGAGDHGVSLKTAMLQWGLAAKRVADNAPKPPPGDWEGAAADAAYARMSAFGNWLQQLADAWNDLAEAAAKVVESHDAAKGEHTGIATEYRALEEQLRQLAAQMTVGNSIATQSEMERIQRRMEELQHQSDEVRQKYADDATFSPVQPADPPGSGADAPTTVGGGGAGGGGGDGHGGGDQPTGDPASMAQKMAQSLGEPQAGAGAKSGAGAPAGGGAPTGGGSPSGESGSGGSANGAPGGMPGGAPSTGTPKLPNDPAIRPAASAGSGSGGGGGGLGASPMSPAVTAETVAPAPMIPVAVGGAPAAGTAGGAMGAGMGGMAPMHGAGAQQGKEKRRDPRLAPDEDLYTEDRPWTEAVVGNRRRKDVHDGKEAT